MKNFDAPHSAGKKPGAYGWWLVAFAVLFLGWICWQTSKVASSVGHSAYNFALSDLEGRTYDLNNLAGKVAIVDFWATWCGPCLKEIPGFIDLHQRYSSQGLEIVGIAMESGSTEKVKQFAQRSGINYRILMGTNEAAKAFGGLEGYPTTFIFDRAGELVARHVGYRPREVDSLEVSPRDFPRHYSTSFRPYGTSHD